ncbi:CoA transferase [Paraburkholderia sp. JHI869]|uniref:CaiB/BaiF CoA transferase family protein n=1 Tax=Paraburkholderia sp. JHI869 TaxID=3112959 RepID=UPI003176EFA2
MDSKFPINNKGPLEGVVVLDFTTQKSGPIATYYLAAMGATIIKIEERKGDVVRGYAPFITSNGQLTLWRKSGDELSLPMLARARGKHSVTLNLKTPQALSIYQELVKRADIVIENYSSGTADRLGIGYKATKALNQRIIYCSISGFGAGVMPGRKAFDVVIQASSGMMLANGIEGGPPVRVGMSIADTLASLYATMGINAALFRRERSGHGEYVDISMLGATTAFLATEDWQSLGLLGEPTRTGNFNVKATPFGIFSCKDGYVAIAAGSRDPIAHSLFRVMGLEAWTTDPRYATLAERCQRNDEVCEVVASWCREYTADEVESLLSNAGIPVEKVRSPAEAISDPALAERGDIQAAEHPTLGTSTGLNTFGLPIRFHETPKGTDGAAPALGQHNRLIYGKWLGFSDETLQEWESNGVI